MMDPLFLGIVASIIGEIAVVAIIVCNAVIFTGIGLKVSHGLGVRLRLGLHISGFAGGCDRLVLTDRRETDAFRRVFNGRVS
jgi:hypothetical protein